MFDGSAAVDPTIRMMKSGQPETPLHVAVDEYYWKPMAAFFRAIELDVIRSAGVQFSGRIVDVGCGDGRVFRMLRRIGVARGTAIGFDISRREIKLAASLDEHQALFLGDVCNIGLPAGTFDVVFANGVFPVIPGGVDASVSECARLLRPGGLLAVTVPTDHFFDVQSVLPKHARRNSRLRDWRIRAANRRLAHRNAFSPEEWSMVFRRHGFDIEHVRPFFGPAAGRIWRALFLNVMRISGALRLLPGPVRSLAREVQFAWIARAVRFAQEREPIAKEHGYVLIVARRTESAG